MSSTRAVVPLEDDRVDWMHDRYYVLQSQLFMGNPVWPHPHSRVVDGQLACPQQQKKPLANFQCADLPHPVKVHTTAYNIMILTTINVYHCFKKNYIC
ncbi:hypothetical protein DFA_00281 [Cavenderia fasciculata]|uniref:Uncharacterized protein n=1 Tax=Cavenderia fasciculata TaxID=261658 RepID=F4PY43_CACFS|nr:uncharacterized protein DFA_00281 [Cavenderia fasciculata]EGG19703.1 hypothetical protein DFA_00281 [Cavenderia fasciculata]|eukprot:XP_004357997.1 hypothetical protein DFA_00281 [Cavenderia fasciculata]